jgi:hypothetical protein
MSKSFLTLDQIRKRNPNDTKALFYSGNVLISEKQHNAATVDFYVILSNPK